MSNKSGPEFRSAAFRREQRGVLAGMLAGLLVPPVCIAELSRLIETAAPAATSLPWLALASLPLVMGIGSMAAHRFLEPSAIDGSNPEGDRRLQVGRAVLRNTVEQTLLFLVVFHTLTTNGWAQAHEIPAAMAVWFVVARSIFAATYVRGAAARSFGFAATFYPSVLGLGAALVLPFF